MDEVDNKRLAASEADDEIFGTRDSILRNGYSSGDEGGCQRIDNGFWTLDRPTEPTTRRRIRYDTSTSARSQRVPQRYSAGQALADLFNQLQLTWVSSETGTFPTAQFSTSWF